MKKGNWLALLLMMCMLLPLCAHADIQQDYDKAQELLAQNRYAEAAEKFTSLGGYEDSTILAMYSKACAFCEEGNFEIGITALEQLGTYKDCTYRVKYYMARMWDESTVGTTEFETMQKAKSGYSEIMLYLDSFERIAMLDERIAAAKKTLYDGAVAQAQQGNFSAAMRTFNRLGSYSDSRQRYTYYNIRAAEIADSNDQDAVIALAKRYADMGTYLDCADRAATMTAKADKIVADKYAKVVAMANEGKYADAEKILASFGKYGAEQVNAGYYAIAEKYLASGQWDAATAAFKKAGDYRDAKRCISEVAFRQAEDIMNHGEYDKAIKAFKKLNGYGASDTMIKECNYRKAGELLQKAQYSEAYALLQSISNYKDAAKIISTNKYLVHERKMNQYAAWNVVSFGTYEGDKIQWSVLKNDGEKLLLACKYVLDVIPEHKGGAIKDWASSRQRAWLNGSFYDNSFSAQEKQCILITALDNGKTKDNVFILSRSEAYNCYNHIAGGKGAGYSRNIRATARATSKGAQECGKKGVAYPKYYYYPTRDGYYSNHHGDRVDSIKGDSYLIPCIYVSLDMMP